MLRSTVLRARSATGSHDPLTRPDPMAALRTDVDAMKENLFVVIAKSIPTRTAVIHCCQASRLLPSRGARFLHEGAAPVGAARMSHQSRGARTTGASAAVARCGGLTRDAVIVL